MDHPASTHATCARLTNRAITSDACKNAAKHLQATDKTSAATRRPWEFGYPIYHAETRTQWRRWLDAHHDTVPGVWPRARRIDTIVAKATNGERAQG